MTRRGRGGLGWVVAAITASACGGKGASKVAAAPAAVDVGRENIAIASTQQLQSGPSVSGTLEARQTATLRAEVAGPVVQTYVDRGQSVEAWAAAGAHR